MIDNIDSLIAIILTSNLFTAIISAFIGRKLERRKTEGQEILNLSHIIKEQSNYMTSMEKRFDEKCKAMEKELDDNRLLIAQQRIEIDELKKKIGKQRV